MSVLLMSAAVMPQAGEYEIDDITAEQFILAVQSAAKMEQLQSYIGYAETSELLAEVTGVAIETNRGEAVLQDGDLMIIARLNRRVNPADKGMTYSIDAFTFQICSYRELQEGRRLI